MTAPNDQFVDIANRSQEAVTAAIRTWAGTMQGFAGKLAPGQQLPDVQSVVGQYFDLAEKVLAGQRELARQWASAATKASETVTQQAHGATQSAAAHTVNGTEAVADTAATTAARVTAEKAAAATPVADDTARD